MSDQSDETLLQPDPRPDVPSTTGVVPQPTEPPATPGDEPITMKTSSLEALLDRRDEMIEALRVERAALIEKLEGLAAQKEAPIERDYQTIADNLLGSPLRENREWLAGWLRNFDKGNFQLKEAPDAVRVALSEAIECVGEFIDISGNEWHDGTPLKNKYKQWKSALRPASQTEEAGK